MFGKKVLIVWEHGGNLGHLSRLLPIALALRQLGCELVFAVADALAASRYLGSLRFNFVRMPRIVLSAPHESGALNHADILLNAGFGEPAQAMTCIRLWHELFGVVRPDVVLADGAPMCLYAARSAGLAAFVMGHGFEIPPLSGERPCFTPWVENATEKSVQLETRLQESFDNLSLSLPDNLRLNAPASLDDLFRSDHALLCAWPEFDHFDRHASQIAAINFYTGPIWAEPPDAKTLDWPDRVGPKVLCYLNLRDKRFDLIWQALLKHGANVLVISPLGVARACDAARGWGIKVIEETLSLNDLLHKCDAIIGHGGIGLTSMALHAGKPVLLLPEHMEQAILAYRLSKQGLASATIRWKDKTLVQKKVSELLATDVAHPQVHDFSERYSAYYPGQAVQSIVSRLEYAVKTP